MHSEKEMTKFVKKIARSLTGKFSCFEVSYILFTSCLIQCGPGVA